MGNKCFGKSSAKDLSNKNNAENKLNENQISILLSNTNYNRQEINEWHSEFLKDCPEGKLNQKAFINHYRKIYPSSQPDAFCEQIFRVFDADSNGYVDFQEFLLSISITSTNTNYKKKLEWIFNLYDIDHNGTIDKNEFRTIIESIYKILDTKKKHQSVNIEQKSNELFQKIDTDRSKTITLDEFIEACTLDKNLIELLAPSF